MMPQPCGMHCYAPPDRGTGEGLAGVSRRISCYRVAVSAVRVCVLRSGRSGILDSYCGFALLVLYFLYLKLVKGALSVFACTENSDGVYILDADPSVTCYKVQTCWTRLWLRGGFAFPPRFICGTVLTELHVEAHRGKRVLRRECMSRTAATRT